MEQYVNFHTPGGKYLGGYTVRGTFPGEMKATKELLAHENGIQPEDIKVSATNGKRRKRA